MFDKENELHFFVSPNRLHDIYPGVEMHKNLKEKDPIVSRWTQFGN